MILVVGCSPGTGAVLELLRGSWGNCCGPGAHCCFLQKFKSMCSGNNFVLGPPEYQCFSNIFSEVFLLSCLNLKK